MDPIGSISQFQSQNEGVQNNLMLKDGINANASSSVRVAWSDLAIAKETGSGGTKITLYT